MSRIKQILCVSAVLGAACFAVAAGSLSASAATKEDVIAAARAAGFPEVYVQAGINKLNEEEYTSEDYDSFIAALHTYEDEIWEKINQQFGTITTAPENGGPSTTVTTTAPVQTEESGSVVTTTKQKPFINMTLEEKVAYVQSLPEEERQQKMIATALNEKIAAIKNGLHEFGVDYDVWFSETSLHESGAIQDVVDLLTQKGMTYEKDGALWLKTTSFGDEKDEVLIRSNGIPTYYAADIAYHKNKFDRGFKRVINIWGADHHGHVARMKGAMDAIGYNSDNLTIMLMQLVRLYQNGEVVRMSTRTGQYVTLQELIEEVGKDAARYFFIMRNPDSHLDFDLDLAKQQSSDNPVYYVQYAHARINSILTATGQPTPKAAEADLTLLKEEAELELIRKIADLPNEIAYAAEELAPYRLARYATDLATMFHSFYNSCRVLTDDQALTAARLVLVNATRITLRNVLTMLGVSAPERM